MKIFVLIILTKGKICIVHLYEKTGKPYQFLTSVNSRVYTKSIKPDSKTGEKIVRSMNQ